MNYQDYYEYQVKVVKDKETGHVVAEIPVLDISDYGPDSQLALGRLKRMLEFTSNVCWMKVNQFLRKRFPGKVSI